ncbi:hypothetical protein GWI33_019408 [Rhynchophorus ferrugineus]|uniref:Uncharacterized protein n=1 Tax=Rhynchophorus ferrugineus TaxID=354439 RepID=A0A834HRQ6_RHYFE|nr:hypothetical protein GWI33_019408 [Rhynchophorus ferrugineus]
MATIKISCKSRRKYSKADVFNFLLPFALPVQRVQIANGRVCVSVCVPASERERLRMCASLYGKQLNSIPVFCATHLLPYNDARLFRGGPTEKFGGSLSSERDSISRKSNKRVCTDNLGMVGHFNRCIPRWG